MGHRQLLIAVALVALAGSGCASTIHARVLDAETRQPIQGAVVLGVWTTVEGLFGLYNHKLVGVGEAETDAEGRFTLERLRSSGLDGEGDGQAVTIYKFGYVAWSNLFLFPDSAQRRNQRVPSEILLDRLPAGATHQRHLQFIDGAQGWTVSEDLMPKFRNSLEQERELARKGERR